ncbi:MAG: type III polyketide synthase [Planctomycetota bacterium]
MTSILGMGFATPDASLPQGRIAEIACGLAGSSSIRRTSALRTLYARSGVSARGSVLATSDGRLPFFEDRTHAPTTGERVGTYTHHALGLALPACLDALNDASVNPAAVTHLVTASCTGFEAPGVDLSLIESLGLTPDVRRTHVGFMGCHAAINAIAAARAFAEAQADAVVLVCCVELCSLHFGPARGTSTAADALFADGAAACVLSADADASGVDLVSTRSTLIPGTAADMSWRIGDQGFEMRLSARVPDVLAQAVPPWIDAWLAELGLKRRDIAGWAIHPGGPRIVERLAGTLGTDRRSVDASLSVLDTHGNMSSPTVLFVAQRLMDEGIQGPIVAMAFGPGLAGEAMLLDTKHKF